jgi:hypothetical protein
MDAVAQISPSIRIKGDIRLRRYSWRLRAAQRFVGRNARP